MILLLLPILLGILLFILINSEPTVDISAEQQVETPVPSSTLVQYLEHIPVVSLSGEGYQLGYLHGSLLKEQIQDIRDTMYAEILGGRSLKGYLLQTYLMYKAKQLDAFIPEKYRREMKGVANGAEVSYNDILLINTYDDLLYLAGCSSIAISKGEKSSRFIHARNLDYPIDLLADKNVIFHHRDYLSIGFPGYIGVLSGTNRHGITISSHTAAVRENAVGVPTGILYRMLLDSAASLVDAEAVLQQHARTIGNNLLVSSWPENQSRVFEITAQNIATVRGAEFAVATNHFTSQEQGALSNATPNSLKRYRALREIYESVESVRLDEVKQKLSNYDQNEAGWATLANWGTVQSVIFLPAEHRLFLGKGTSAPVNMSGYLEYQYGSWQ